MAPKNYIILRVLALLCLWNTALQGQSGFVRNQFSFSSPLEMELDISRILVYVDSNNQLDLDDIKNLNLNSFIEGDMINRFDEQRTYWLYYILENRSEENISHLLKGGANAKETYFISLDEKITFTEKKTGYHISANQRDIHQGYSTKIKLDQPGRSKAHIFVKISSTDGMPIELKAELRPFEKWQTYNDGINLFEGIFSGLLIVIAIISLFLYGYTRYTVFVYFSAYCVSNLLYFLHTYGILEIWFYPNHADPLPFLWLLPLLSGGFYFSFARYFLELKEFRAKIDPWLGYASKAMIALFVIACLYLAWSGSIFLPMQIMGIGLIVAAAFTLIVLILIHKQGNLITKYFSYGTIFLILSVVVAVVLNLTRYSNEIPIYVQLGIMVETLIFSLGISHKLKRDFENHEITQKSLILQLQNNDKLSKKANEDLTELVAARTQQIKKKNKQLEKARNEAEKATLAKSEFLSVMSHEIRTPLNAIISLSHIMEMDNDSEEMQEYIDALKFSAEGLHSLINDVLDYNKIEADKLKLESIDFSIIDLLSNIRDSFKYKAKSQNIDLLIEIGEHMPDRIIGDPTRITQIFNNLIGNALKFTQDGQVHVKASLLGLKDEKVSIKFEVNDTGIGIPKEKLETIFEAYEQAGRETAREYGGTGLGLSITQKLLKLMGSEISIASTEKEGTSLAFEIDFQIDRGFDLVNLQDQMRDKDLKNKKLLVVDDNEMNRLVLNRLLTNWNARIEQASNGEQAIALSKDQQFDLILMDLEMKPLNGIETVKVIQSEKQSQNKDCPIIAISAFLSAEFDGELESANFQGVILKPFEPNELYRKIVEQLNPIKNEKAERE